MVATRWFKVDIGPSWELVDALVRLCSLRKVLPLRPWLSVSRTITADLTWPGPMTEMPKRTRTWVLDDPYRPPSPMVAQYRASLPPPSQKWLEETHSPQSPAGDDVWQPRWKKLQNEGLSTPGESPEINMILQLQIHRF